MRLWEHLWLKLGQEFHFLSLLLANHEPVHWTIKCEGWKELSYEIQQDQHLDEESKLGLIDYFKTKVEEECDFKP